MNSLLQNMMAQMESWEAATEFGIPEIQWAEYDARRRSDDIYIGCLASVFDTLRLEDEDRKRSELTALANTLVLFSRSAAARYLTGVEKNLNQLYSAALYYLGGYPATGVLLAREQNLPPSVEPEEAFLLGFLRRETESGSPLTETLTDLIRRDELGELAQLRGSIEEATKNGLKHNPRAYIAAKLALNCISGFEESNVWSALREYAAHYSPELWRPFLGNASSFPIWELLPSQLAALRSGLFGDADDVFSLQMPTSSGKTALCELLIYHEVKARQKRVLFLVPFRALAAEVRDGMSRRLTEAGVSVIASHGGNIPTRSEVTTIEDADVLIVTPEKFTALLQVTDGLDARYHTIICDEGHLIDDESRGLQYELLLTKLRGSQSVPRKVVFMSAILPNIQEIHAWLGGNEGGLATSDYRPVPLDYAFLSQQPRSTDSWQLEFNPLDRRPRNFFLVRFLTKDDLRYVNSGTGRLKLIAGWNSYLSFAAASALKAARHGSVALFTTTKRDSGVAGLAKKLIDLCELRAKAAEGLPAVPGHGEELAEYIAFIFGDEYLLTRLLRYGAGFHHGSLPQEVRRAMEEGIQTGAIRILVCTTTLAEGVNLPIRTLVVHTVRRYHQDANAWVYLPNRTIKNIIGRAGRAGKETRGRIIFVTDTERERLENVLRDERMEPAKGALFRLIDAIERFRTRHRLELQNEVFEAQPAEFLSIMDSIDFALLDLIPEGTPQDQLDRHIDELVEKTLAERFCDTNELRNCLRTVFRIRADHLQESVDANAWPILRKSGASPRLWQFVSASDILNSELWPELDDVTNEAWIDGVVLRMLDHPTIQIENSLDAVRQAMLGWFSGHTYSEIAAACHMDIDATLDLLCQDIGYHLQDAMAKLTQLAIEARGEDSVSETARAWPSMLQYGLGNLQQLDIYQAGCTERLATWGLSRHLAQTGIELRGNALVAHVRETAASVKAALRQDERVPRYSEARLCRELGI